MFGKTFRLWIVPTIAALALSVAPASATTITYDTFASWQAVSTGAQMIDFENGCLANCPGVSFTGFGIGIIQETTDLWWNYGTGKAAYINTNSSPTPIIHIALTTPVTAFGFNIFTVNPNGLPFTVTFLSTPYTIATNNPPTATFFGVTSDTPINSIDVSIGPTAAGAYELVDNFRFGTAQLPADPTPEAATFLLIGSGLIGLMGLRKRIMKSKPDLSLLQTNPVLSPC